MRAQPGPLFQAHTSWSAEAKPAISSRLHVTGTSRESCSFVQCGSGSLYGSGTRLACAIKVSMLYQYANIPVSSHLVYQWLELTYSDALH